MTPLTPIQQATAPGSPRVEGAVTYDRLARLGFHRWWTPPVAVLTVALVWISLACGGVAVSAMTARAGDPTQSSGSPLVENLTMLAGLALFTPIVLGVAALVQRRPAGTLHSVTGRIRWRWLGICVALAMVFAVLLILAMSWMYDLWDEPVLTIGWKRLLWVGALLLVLVPLQAAGEEYVSRGFLLQTLGAYHRWVGVIGSSLVFAALHGFGTWSGFAALLCTAVIWALLVIRTGGLEVTIAAHAATNLLAFLLSAASGGLDVVDDTSATDAPAPLALLMAGVGVCYALSVLGLVRVLARHRPHLVPANTAPPTTSPRGTDDSPSAVTQAEQQGNQADHDEQRQPGPDAAQPGVEHQCQPDRR